MAKNQEPLSDSIRIYLKMNYDSPRSFADSAGFKNATLARMLRENAYKLDALMSLGEYDEEITLILIQFLTNTLKKSTHNGNLLTQDLTYQKNEYNECPKCTEANKRIDSLQNKLIESGQNYIDLQNVLLNKPKK